MKKLTLLCLSTAMAAAANAQTIARPTPPAATATTTVPMLVRYSGFGAGTNGAALKSTSSVTFLIFRDETGGEPIWSEMQSVTIDPAGHYEVYLGAGNVSGLPADLFSSGEARWLEVQVAGEPMQPRVLLVSVPYAMKAADATTLGGLPASAFALAGTTASSPQALSATPDASASTVTTPGGTAGYLPVYSGATTIDDSIVFQSGTKIGIGTKAPAAALDIEGAVIARGLLTLENNGTATTSAGKNSQALAFTASAYNASTKKIVSPLFTLQAEPAGNNTASPGATLNLLYGNGGTPAETGLSISSKGIIKFASGQTFSSSSTSGTGLIGSSSSGTGVEGTSSYATGVEGNTAGSTDGIAGVLGVAGARNTNGFSDIAGVWGDASKHIGVLGTSDQFAGVQGISSAGPGVQGVSLTGVGIQGTSNSNTGVSGTSTKGTGVIGLSTTNDGMIGYTAGNTLNTAGSFGFAGQSSGFSGIAGVWGDSTTHVGVFGTSIQASGILGQSSSGVGVQGTSANNSAGSFSTSSSATTVFATNTASSGGSALSGVAQGDNGTALYASEFGANGNGVQAFGNGNGVIGDTSGGVLNTAGVLGIAGSRTGVGGIAGVWGDAQEHVGVIGSSKDYSGVFASSANSYGVQAVSTGTAGVYGVGGSSNISSYSSFFGNSVTGVWGDVSGTSDELATGVVGTGQQGSGGFFENNSDTVPTLRAYNYGQAGTEIARPFKALEAATVDGICGFGGKGDMTCTGQVKTLATIASGARTVETYSMQSPENWMEDFGAATLQNGTATVALDAAFAETVSGTADYHVFLTPNGDSKGLYVASKTSTGFEVRESGGGKSTLGFDYRIVGKRRGYEAQRLVDITDRFKVEKDQLTRHTKAIETLHRASGN